MITAFFYYRVNLKRMCNRISSQKRVYKYTTTTVCEGVQVLREERGEGVSVFGGPDGGGGGGERYILS